MATTKPQQNYVILIMPSVTIIDYGSGNLHSISKAFERQSGGIPIRVSDKIEDITSASHIVLPGVGAFGDCINGLKARPGLIEALNEEVMVKKKPFFGVCVGMQMLAEQGLEHGTHQGLGWIKGTVRPIPHSPTLKIPHMGWNNLEISQDHPAIARISQGDHAYFVHSYYFDCEEKNAILATVNYGKDLCAMVAKDNIIGTQFHPEKSQKTGLQVIKNFLQLT